MKTKNTKQLARRMRHNPTEAERHLWAVLRRKQLQPCKFRRQHPIGPYIADFACITHRLVVEADGSQHANSADDLKRTALLENWGWKVVRFWNSDILGDNDSVLEAIFQALQGRENSHLFTPPQLEWIRDSVNDIS